MLNSFLHHLTRVEDLICDDEFHINPQRSNLTVTDLDRFMKEKTCAAAKLVVKEKGNERRA